MSEIDWSKAPHGATHAAFTGTKDGHHVWYKLLPRGYQYLYSDDLARGDSWANGSGGPGHYPLIPRLESWTGTGLPPVGAVCEVDYCEQWHECEVIAHFQQRAGMVAAFTVDMGDGAKALNAFGAEYFRPIRTEAQIAAEERNKALEALTHHFALHSHPDVPWEDLFSQMYDAGVRWQEPKP